MKKMIPEKNVMKNFSDQLAVLQKMDLKKIFSAHQPPPINQQDITHTDASALMKHLQQHSQQLSLSHMPHQASIQFQKLMGQYHQIVGHLGDRGGVPPLYSPLQKLGAQLDSLGSHLHEKNVIQSQIDLKQVKQSQQALEAKLKQNNIGVDNEKDPLVVAFKKIAAPLFALSTLPSLAFLGTIKTKVPAMAGQFKSNSAALKTLLDARLGHFSKNNTVPKSKMFQSMHDDIASLKLRVPKKMQDSVTKQTAAIKKATATVNQCKKCEDFSPGAKGHLAMLDINKHLKGMNKTMSATALDPFAAPIKQTGTLIQKLKLKPKIAPTLIKQSSALHAQLAKGFTLPNLFKRPMLGDAIAMMPPFLFLQNAIPGMHNKLKKSAVVANQYASAGQVTVKGASATIDPHSIQSLKSLSKQISDTSEHLKASHTRMKAHDQQEKAQFSLTEKSNELKKHNSFLQHKKTLDETSEVLAVKKQQMKQCPAYLKLSQPIEEKTTVMKADAAKAQAGTYKEKLALLDHQVQSLAQHMQENPKQIPTLLPALNNMQASKALIAIPAGAVVAATVLALGGDQEAADTSQALMSARGTAAGAIGAAGRTAAAGDTADGAAAGNAAAGGAAAAGSAAAVTTGGAAAGGAAAVAASGVAAAGSAAAVAAGGAAAGSAAAVAASGAAEAGTAAAVTTGGAAASGAAAVAASGVAAAGSAAAVAAGGAAAGGATAGAAGGAAAGGAAAGAAGGAAAGGAAAGAAGGAAAGGAAAGAAGGAAAAGGAESAASSQKSTSGSGSGKKTVCLGGILQCTGGIVPTPIVVMPQGVFANTIQPVANIMTSQANLNIIPFGMCISPTHPGVIPLGPQPCAATVTPWIPTILTMLFGGLPPISTKNKSICMIAAMPIRPISAGQSSMMSGG